MGSNYKKIQYESEGNYASTEKHYLYIAANRSVDSVNVYDEDGDLLFGFCEWGNFDMGNALVVAFSNWNDDRMEDVSIDEINMIKNKKK